LKLLIFSDIHNDWKALERLLGTEADLYISAGDQGTWAKGLERAGEVLSARRDKVYVLPGNHESAEQVAAMCARYGLNDFHQRHLQLGRWHVAGLGYSSPTPFNTPGEYSEEAIASALAAFSGIRLLHLVAHCPPAGTKLDEYAPGKHAGSMAVRDWVEREQPTYLFCGHIHEAAGLRDSIGVTQCVNVGKQGFTIDI